MTALIDTHTLIWMLDDPSHLTATASAFVRDPANRLLLSVGSAWEISIKAGNGRLSLSSVPLLDLFTTVLTTISVEIFAISPQHLVAVSRLPNHHRDPFDRLLAAQCLVEGLPIVSTDAVLDAYGVRRIW